MAELKTAWLLLLLSATQLAACTTRDEPSLPPPEAPTPKLSRMAEAIGPAMTSVVREPKRVEVGVLRLIGAAKAEEQRFRAPDLIAGYPIEGALREISPVDARALAEVVLADQSYAVGPVQRCRNDDLLGARFSVGEGKVELALGRPCAQGFLVFQAANGIATDGGRMTEEAIATITRIIVPKN